MVKGLSYEQIQKLLEAGPFCANYSREEKKEFYSTWSNDKVLVNDIPFSGIAKVTTKKGKELFAYIEDLTLSFNDPRKTW